MIEALTIKSKEHKFNKIVSILERNLLKIFKKIIQSHAWRRYIKIKTNWRATRWYLKTDKKRYKTQRIHKYNIWGANCLHTDRNKLSRYTKIKKKRKKKMFLLTRFVKRLKWVCPRHLLSVDIILFLTI